MIAGHRRPPASAPARPNGGVRRRASRRVGASRGIPTRLAALVVSMLVLAGCNETFAGLEPTGQPAPSVTMLEGRPSTTSAPPQLATPGPSGSPAAPIGPATARITGQLFGMAGHLMWRGEDDADLQLDMLQADHMKVVRFDVSWRKTETTRGQYRLLSKLDYIVHDARQRGLEIIISVLETPGWANGGRGLWDPPDDPEDYGRFVGVLASRYAGQILGWEIWNEPDLDIFWSPKPSARAYTKLLLAASRAIRAADPSAAVVASGPTFGNISFLEGIYDAGARGSFDALAVHPYTLSHSPDDTSNRYYSLPLILDHVRNAMRRRGDGDTPVWVTELGWSLTGGTAVTVAQRDAYTVRSVEIIRERPWIQVLTLYATDSADDELRGLSENGVRSSTWRAYVNAVNNP